MRNIKSKIREYDEQHAICVENIEKITNKAKGSAEAARKALYDRQEGYKNNKTRITEGLARLEKEIESFEGEKYRQSEELKVHLRAAEQLQMRCKDIERHLRDAKEAQLAVWKVV